MGKTHDNSTPGRRALLAVLMLAVLLATVAVAWVLQSASARRVRAAAALLAQLREDGLDSFWPADLKVDWYLVHKNDRVIGCRAIAAGRSEDGEFLGADVLMLGDGGGGTCEHWRLNADATEGLYRAFVWTDQAPRLDTQIALRGGVVRVEQHNLSLSARSPAPENYLPEGLLEAAVRRVAAAGGDAQFKLVFNHTPNRVGVVEYGTYRVRRLGRERKSEGAWVNRVRVAEARRGGGYAATYELNDEGDLLGVLEDTGLGWTPASEGDVVKRYRLAPAQLLRLMPDALRARLAPSLPRAGNVPPA